MGREQEKRKSGSEEEKTTTTLSLTESAAPLLLADDVSDAGGNPRWPDKLMKLKNILREAQDDKAARRRSRVIDASLAQDAQRYHSIRNVQLLSPDRVLATRFLAHMRILHGDDFTAPELQGRRDSVRSSAMQAVRLFLSTVEEDARAQGPALNEKTRRLVVELAAECRKGDHLALQDAKVASTLWAQAHLRQLCKAREPQWPDWATYFLDDVERTAQPDYAPVAADLLRDVVGCNVRFEHTYQARGWHVNVWDMDCLLRCNRERWIRHLRDLDVHALLMVIDLADYDELAECAPHHSRLMQSLVVFQDVAASSWYKDRTLVVFLANAALFGRKLASAPLGGFFPDYTGGADAQKARDFVAGLVRARQDSRKVLIHFGELDDAKTLDFILDVIQDEQR